MKRYIEDADIINPSFDMNTLSGLSTQIKTYFCYKNW